MGLITRLKSKVRRGIFKLKGMKIGFGGQLFHSLDIVNPQNVTIGKESILYKNVTIYLGANGHFQLGDRSHVAPFGYFLIDNNNLEIGDHVAIGPSCTFICHSNAIQGASKLFCENYDDGDITIGNNVFIGAQCTILPGTIIKDNVVVASNSVVKGILEGDTVYGGSPAKEIKKID